MKYLKLFEDMTDGGRRHIHNPKKSKEEELRKSRQDKIDDFDTYFKNLKILKNYIDQLDRSTGEINKLILYYAIVLHNYIILERRFSSVVPENLKINKHLDIVEIPSSTYWINSKLVELYDPEHIIRNNVEEFSEIKEIRHFLDKQPEIFKRVYTEEEIDFLLQSDKYNL